MAKLNFNVNSLYTGRKKLSILTYFDQNINSTVYFYTLYVRRLFVNKHVKMKTIKFWTKTNVTEKTHHFQKL